MKLRRQGRRFTVRLSDHRARRPGAFQIVRRKPCRLDELVERLDG